MTLALTIAAQAQRDTIGVSQFTAIYRYECKTMDAEGKSVTDSMLIAVQVSNGVTKSFPYEEYDRQKKGRFRIVDGYQAAHMHMGTFFMNYPEGRITAQEMLYPYRYQTDETLDIRGIHTFTLCGLLKEEQPIVFAEYVTWIVPDGRGKFVSQRVDYQKLKASKFRAYKKKVLSNSRYLQNPTYYAPDPMETFGYVETSYNSAGDNVRSVAGVVIVSNPHQYQPLEQ